jgi:Cu2+-containing amine oxidase
MTLRESRGACSGPPLPTGVQSRQWTELGVGVQPPIMLDEFEECEVNCKKDPGAVEALAGRGMTDLDLVCIEPWSAGYSELMLRADG